MKDKITKASIRLFEQKGFSETSIQDIVDALGVTKGTFYYYFTSKKQLLMVIHQEYISELLRRQEDILEEGNAGYREKLEKVLELLIGDIEKNGPSGRVFFREIRHLGDENMEIITSDRDRFRINIENLIREGMEAGEFRSDLRPDMLTFGILGMANYSYNWFDPSGEVSAEGLSSLYAEMVLHGIEKK